MRSGQAIHGGRFRIARAWRGIPREGSNLMAFLAFALTLALSPVALAQQVAVPVRFEPARLDFGFVTPGERYEATVTVMNTSQQPIPNIRLSSSCSCTSASFGKTTLGPGESATLTVVLHASYAMIDRTTQIRFSADPQRFNAPAELGVRSYPNEGLVASPHMIAGSTDGVAPITGQITVSSVDGKPFTVKSVNYQPYSAKQAEASSQTVAYHMHGATKRHWLVIETTHPSCPFMVVPVGDGALRRESLTFARAESIQLADRREITLGYLEPGQSVELVLPIFRPAATLEKSVAVVSRQAGISAALVGWENQKFSHGSRQSPVYQVDAKVRFTATGQPGEPFMGTLQLQAEGDRTPLTVHVVGRIVEAGQGTHNNDSGNPPPGLLRPTE